MSRLFGERQYPHTAGFVPASVTSQAAAASVNPKLGELHQLVLRLFKEAGERGLTDNELQAAGETASILRPRRIELTAIGKLRASGRTRLTGSNRHAEVWVLA